jgi:hypothetical protein
LLCQVGTFMKASSFDSLRKCPPFTLHHLSTGIHAGSFIDCQSIWAGHQECYFTYFQILGISNDDQLKGIEISTNLYICQNMFLYLIIVSIRCQASCTSQHNQNSELMERASAIHLYISTPPLPCDGEDWSKHVET